MQNYGAASSGAGMGGMLMIDLIALIVGSLIIGYPLYVMAQKANLANPWMAFVPILNLVTMVQLAGKEMWWIILFFIPCVGAVVAIICWMAIAERMNKPSWIGILMIIPGVNILVPWYIALG